MKIDVAVFRAAGMPVNENEDWRVFVDGQITTPSFNSRGAAMAYKALIEAGVRPPEFPRPTTPAPKAQACSVCGREFTSQHQQTCEGCGFRRA